MSKFKEGDRVQAIAPCDHDSSYIGKKGTVINVYKHISSGLNILVTFDDMGSWACEESSLKKINKSIMLKVSIMMKKLLDENTQTLVKAGYINGDLDFTEEGTQALMSLAFSAAKDELVKMAEEKIAEEKADK